MESPKSKVSSSTYACLSQTGVSPPLTVSVPYLRIRSHIVPCSVFIDVTTCHAYAVQFQPLFVLIAPRLCPAGIRPPQNATVIVITIVTTIAIAGGTPHRAVRVDRLMPPQFRPALLVGADANVKFSAFCRVVVPVLPVCHSFCAYLFKYSSATPRVDRQLERDLA